MIFKPDTIAPATTLERERARFSLLLPTAQVAALSALALALAAGYFGSRMLAPVLIARGFSGSVLLELWSYFVVFAALAMPLVLVSSHVFRTYALEPWARLAVLSPADVTEAVCLADRWPEVEAYRLAVAQARQFVRGDLDVMRELAAQAQAGAQALALAEQQAADRQRLTWSPVADGVE